MLIPWHLTINKEMARQCRGGGGGDFFETEISSQRRTTSELGFEGRSTLLSTFYAFKMMMSVSGEGEGEVLIWVGTSIERAFRSWRRD